MERAPSFRIRFGFWVVSFLIGWFATLSWPLMLIWVAVILVSVLVHEGGHALAFMSFGQPCRVELTSFGGVTIPGRPKQGRSTLKTWKMVLVTLAGPAAGLALAGLALLLGGGLDPTPQNLYGYALSLTVVLNLIWTVANLLPVMPLDGGQVIRQIAQRLFGERAIRGVFVWSFLFSAVSALALLVLFMAPLPAILLALLAVQNGVSWWSSRGVSESDLRDDVRCLFEDALRAISEKRYDIAEEQLRQLIKDAPEGLISNAAHEQLAELEERYGHYQEAFDLLQPIATSLDAQALLLYHELAFTLDQYDEVIKVGNICFQELPDEQVAFRNSLAYAAKGDSVRAMNWFEAAWENGLPNPQECLKRAEYDQIRGTSSFQNMHRALQHAA